MSSFQFHERVGRLVQLSNNRTSARRIDAAAEFNDGVVFSDRPLKHNEIFSVVVMETVLSWNGSIEIGLVGSDPMEMEVPRGIAMHNGDVWWISGSSTFHFGTAVYEDYCQDLDTLKKGDTVGIMRNNRNEMHLFINGVDQGCAAICDVEKVWATIDMYGICSGIDIQKASLGSEISSQNASDVQQMFRNTELTAIHESASSDSTEHVYEYAVTKEGLCFHKRCGSLIEFHDDYVTAERTQPEEEFNNGVVMTNRSLADNELFEIRINGLVHKWSGSIEIGITTHDPNTLEIPSTMTNLRSGTIMFSGCGILTNGKGTRKHYSSFHLDQLKINDHIGVVKKSNGMLHYFINGVDQGVASTGISSPVFGVVDLYGMTVNVSIVQPHSVDDRLARNRCISTYIYNEIGLFDEYEGLMLNEECCGRHVSVINGTVGRRTNPIEDFNHAVLFTSRHLKKGEKMTIRIDELVDKWAGSMEIGVTTLDPADIDFPATATNLKTGNTWIMTASGIMYNGATILEEYGINSDTLKVGDTLSVMRRHNGNIHFFSNDTDLGLAATDVPENIYGIVDLYGQTCKATLVRDATEWHPSVNSAVSLMREYFPEKPENNPQFDETIHGLNIKHIGRYTVYRDNALKNFDGAIAVIDKELIGPIDNVAFVVDSVVSHWTGSLEVAVISTNLGEFDYLSDTIMQQCVAGKNKDILFAWSGNEVYINGKMNKITYSTVNLRKESIIQIKRMVNNVIQVLLDGTVIINDAKIQELPCHVAVNLYGKCAQVTVFPIHHNDDKTKGHDLENDTVTIVNMSSKDVNNYIKQNQFKDRVVNSYYKNEKQNRNKFLYGYEAMSFHSSVSITVCDTKENVYENICIGLVSLQKGHTVDFPDIKCSISETINISQTNIFNDIFLLTANTSTAIMNNARVKRSIIPQLKSLKSTDKITLELCSTSNSLNVKINDISLGPIVKKLSMNKFDFYPFIVFNGKRITGINMTEESSHYDKSEFNSNNNINNTTTATFQFSCEIKGKNIELSADGLTAQRVNSFDQGFVVTKSKLPKNTMFQIMIKNKLEKWASSVVIGICCQDLKTVKYKNFNSVYFAGKSVFQGNYKILDLYCNDLNKLESGHMIGLLLKDDCLHLYIDDIDQGPVSLGINSENEYFAFVDLQGNCNEIEIVSDKVLQKLNDGNKIKEQQKDSASCSKKVASSRFFHSLGLPKAYLDIETLKCFCQDCFIEETDVKDQGDPSLQFLLPKDWCRIGLNMHPNVDISTISKYWNIAYYGTDIGVIRKALDLGEVPIENDDDSLIFDLRGKEAGPETKKKGGEILSPIINYVSEEKYSQKFTYTDITTSGHKQEYIAQVAFQVFLKPGTFKITPLPHAGDSSTVNSNKTCLEVCEWSTKHHGTTVLSHLLVKLNPTNNV